MHSQHKPSSNLCSSFRQALATRKNARSTPSYNGNIKQGTSIPGLSLSPYNFSNSIQYVKGLLAGDAAAINQCQLPIGKNETDQIVGVLKGTLNETKIEEKSNPVRIIFAGDLMVSKSGESIQLGNNFLHEIQTADALVINIESPLNFDEKETGRKGLNFSMSKSYLIDFIQQIKNKNPSIKIIYHIANNHALDGSNEKNPLSSHEKRLMQFSQNTQRSEQETKKYTEEKIRYEKLKHLFKIDPDNFVLLRTIAVIQEIDSDALIIGAHFNEDKYLDAKLSPTAILELKGLRIGLFGFTDILNHNAYYWDKRVIRTEDITENIEAIKQEMGLNYLYLFAHGNLEQSIFPTPAWRDLATKLLKNGADGFIGHGPHVPQTNEILKIKDQQKLLIHSLGNLFGPEKLSNTGLNILAVLDFYPNKIEFEIKPIEAYLNNDKPCVQIVENNKTHYPHLLKRLFELFPLNSLESQRQAQLPSIGNAVTNNEVTRLLILDGTNGAVACRVHGKQLANPFPHLSPEHSVETSLRSRLRLNNLIAVRGEPNQGMIGPGDYYGNWEKPHQYSYTISLEKGFPTIYQHSSRTMDTAAGRAISENEITTVNTHWVSGTNKHDIDEIKAEYQKNSSPLVGDSLFKNSGILEIDANETIILKRFDATTVDLTPFKASLVPNNSPFTITTEALPPKTEWRAVSYQFDPAYAKRQIEIGGGLFLETHDFAQSMTPLDRNTGGFIILGKWEDEKKKDRLHVIGFQIPFGYTLIVGKDCIHGDTTLAGMYMMCMTSNHVTMSSADTVFLKNKTTKLNMTISLENGLNLPASDSLDASELAPKPIFTYTKYDSIDSFVEKIKPYDIMCNPFSNGWIKTKLPSSFRGFFYNSNFPDTNDSSKTADVNLKNESSLKNSAG